MPVNGGNCASLIANHSLGQEVTLREFYIAIVYEPARTSEPSRGSTASKQASIRSCPDSYLTSWTIRSLCPGKLRSVTYARGAASSAETRGEKGRKSS